MEPSYSPIYLIPRWSPLTVICQALYLLLPNSENPPSPHVQFFILFYFSSLPFATHLFLCDFLILLLLPTTLLVMLLGT